MRASNYYAHPGFERAGLRRRDMAWITEQAVHPASVFVPVWRSQSLVVEIAGGEPRAALLSVGGLAAVGATDSAENLLVRGELVFLGVIEERPHFALDLSETPEPPLEALRTPILASPVLASPVLASPVLASVGSAEAGVRFSDLRQLAGRLDRHEGALLAFARAMAFWHSRHRYCGVCGSPTRSEEAGHMRRCTNPGCNAMHFPRTDPAVIMLVTDGERALLGRNKNFIPGMYSTLAGFVEPGESLEDAVAREVREETGIEVGAVHYHSSQPWPFPANIMLGFHAEAVSIDIAVDYGELEDARWFERQWLIDHVDDDSFRLPRRDSIARRLVEDWLYDRSE